MDAVEVLAPDVGTKSACKAFGISRAGLYRRRVVSAAPRLVKKRSAPPRALSEPEKQDVLETLHSERFQDMAPHEVYATLLDEERYLCSIRGMCQ
jgi:putative transposase